MAWHKDTLDMIRSGKFFSEPIGSLVTFYIAGAYAYSLYFDYHFFQMQPWIWEPLPREIIFKSLTCFIFLWKAVSLPFFTSLPALFLAFPRQQSLAILSVS